MIATASESGRPVIGVTDGLVIVDLHRQPLNFVAYFLVSAAMRIQRQETRRIESAEAAAGVDMLMGKTEFADQPHHLLDVERAAPSPDFQHQPFP